MRVLMTEDSNNPVSNSFLLDDDSRLLSLCFYQSMPLIWSSSTYVTALYNAAYHSPLMTYPNQWSRLISLTSNHHHWSGRTLALYSCCHHLNRCVVWRTTWSTTAATRMMIGRLSMQRKESIVTDARWNEVHGFLISTVRALQMSIVHMIIQTMANVANSLAFRGTPGLT